MKIGIQRNKKHVAFSSGCYGRLKHTEKTDHSSSP
jgi:hypothetical protein